MFKIKNQNIFNEHDFDYFYELISFNIKQGV